jgi:hypothetical protein
VKFKTGANHTISAFTAAQLTLSKKWHSLEKQWYDFFAAYINASGIRNRESGNGNL